MFYYKLVQIHFQITLISNTKMGEVKVIGTVESLFCARILWALKLKGIEYEFLEEDLRNKSPILVKYNPIHKKVPVLVHQGRAIAESLVILEYVDEFWKENPLLPQDSYAKARARFLAKFSDEKVVFGAYGACVAEEEDEKKKAIASALELLAFLEKEIEGNKYFSGKEIGYLDLVVGWIPLWLSVMEEIGNMKLLEADKFPSLYQWSQKFLNVPLIKECSPDREKLVNYFNEGISYRRSLEAANKP